MAYLYLGSETPYKAAQVLKKGIEAKQIEPTSKNLETLGIALRQAQHTKDAIPYLERAAKLADEGELWGRLANIYLDADRYGECSEAAGRALRKGSLRREDNVHVVQGMCLYNQHKYKEAKRSFSEARNDKRSKRVSDQWIKFLDTEIEREKELKRGV